MRKDQRGVFISYRRDGGSDVARVIQAFLESKGFDPFLDVDGLGSGHFDSQLLQRIEECPHFILICSPGALDRVVNDGDWVRREIEHALKTSRNIVPVVVPGFDWSKIGSLPGEISEISSHNHFDYHHAHWTQIRHKLLALLEPRSPEPPVEQPKRAGPWQSLIDLDPLDPIHSADPLKLLVVSDLMRELESETGLARESVCWELLEYSVPLWRTNSNSASLCFARLSCALEVDCPGVGAPAPPTAARLVGAL